MYDLTTELFAEWAIGLVIIAIRLYTRCSTGIQNLYWDDLFLAFVVVIWTMHTIFLYLVEVFGSNIGFNEETAMLVPDSEIPRRRKGAIFAFIAWLCYIFLVWAFKGVLMFLYNRLTMGLWQQKLTRRVGILCVATFFASFLLHMLSCLPTHQSWQVKPYPGDNCTLRPLNYIVIEVLNIATDVGIMCIPIPLIATSKVPLTQKIILCVLFSTGLFVIVTSILRAYYSVRNIYDLDVALAWASREAFVSVIVVCAPGIKPLCRKFSWFSKIFGGHSDGSTPGRRTGRSSMFDQNGTFATISVAEGKNEQLEMAGRWIKRTKTKRLSSGDSQEHIIDSDAGERRKHGDENIVVTTEYKVGFEAAPSTSN
ncbi:hypothetical protein FQN53_005220 [Emmonsiellopsis sp. PD_33]|nr:hypothetical protein FQN53_005220 [Emmonsiellopsis sp. PD_33]